IAKKLAKKKWLTISWAKEFGGMGASYKEQLIFKEEVGYWGIPGSRMGVSGTGWVGPSIMLFGSKAQQEKYLPSIAAGEPDGIWCTGYSEPDSGSDLASLQTRADKKGDHYILNGQKVWTSVAHRARYCWLAARTNSNVTKKHHGLSLFVVDLKSKGITVRPLKNFAGFHVFNEIFFNDVEVPAENLVGQENNGWRHLMQALSFERGTAIEYCGILKRVLEELVQYAKEEGLMKKTLVRHNIAELAIDLEAARMLAYEADWKKNNNLSRTYEPSRDKANVDILFERLTRFGMNLMNANAMIDPLCKKVKWTKVNGMIEHLYYICPGMAIAAGTTFTQKNIVGQFGLQLPRAY
ncbi:MAG: hypothetical protein GY864_09505, partial [Desulfobacterales bacterium]|nr:hypothetical protein [Desulfobacterales bacterium]